MNAPIYLSRPGVVCCAGGDFDAAFASACAGSADGIVPVTVRGTAPADGERRFLAGRACIPNKSIGDADETRLLPLCRAALVQIRPDVELALSRWGPERIALCLGSCDNGTEWSVPAHRAFFSAGAFPPGYRIALQGAAPPAEYAARFLGLRGPVLSFATACASSATAIIRAAELVQAGVCDAAVAGGADIVSDTVLLGFSALEAVSDERSNPFSKNRKGINLGEAAAFFVLSREPLKEEPRGRGVVLAGWGESADARHITAPHPEGTGAAAAMRAALKAAGIAPSDIGYVNLHGTGTLLNDPAEALAMRAVFGEEQPPSSSTKPVTGHTLGAAGALEAALCRGVLERGKIPPHCWNGVRDEALPELRLAGSGPAQDGKIRFCMSNSFAFGGCNVSLILGGEEAGPFPKKGNRR